MKNVKNLNAQNSNGSTEFNITREVMNRLPRNKCLEKNNHFTKENELPWDSHMEFNLSLLGDR